MLTVKRRIGEELIFRVRDLEFSVIVTDVRGAQVQVPINTPREGIMLRDELLQPDDASGLISDDHDSSGGTGNRLLSVGNRPKVFK